MAFPNLTSDLSNIKLDHVPESLQEPYLCMSHSSIYQFRYSTQWSFLSYKRSCHSQLQLCKNLGNITGCKRKKPKCKEQTLSLGSCSPKAYSTFPPCNTRKTRAADENNCSPSTAWSPVCPWAVTTTNLPSSFIAEQHVLWYRTSLWSAVLAVIPSHFLCTPSLLAGAVGWGGKSPQCYARAAHQ